MSPHFPAANLRIFPDEQQAAVFAATVIEARIRAKAAEGKFAVLGLATGQTPLAVYRELVRRHRTGGLSFRSVITFNLDEYCDLPPEHPQSYRFFMERELFSQVDIAPEHTHVPNGMGAAKEHAAHCREYEAAIRAAGGIDLQILGIGRTGHIGFNEPPAGPETRTRCVELNALTLADNARFFGSEECGPRPAVTWGVGTFLVATQILLRAFGPKKAPVVARALTAAPAEECPASWLQRHSRCTWLVDLAAGAELPKRSFSDETV